MVASFQAVSVLLIDGNAYARRILRSACHTLRVGRIMEADTAERGLLCLDKDRPDLVVVDWSLPCGGLDLVRTIRNPDNATGAVPIIVVATAPKAAMVREARDCGVHAFLARPLTVSALERQMRHILFTPRPFVRSASYFGPCRRIREVDFFEGQERRESAGSDDILVIDDPASHSW